LTIIANTAVGHAACNVTDNVPVVPSAQYTLYYINNALFSPNRCYSGITRGGFFDKHRHTRYLRVPHITTSPLPRTPTHKHIYMYNIIPRLKYGGKKLREFQYRVQSYRKILIPGNHRHGNRQIRYRRVYHTHTHSATHILYIYICMCVCD